MSSNTRRVVSTEWIARGYFGETPSAASVARRRLAAESLLDSMQTGWLDEIIVGVISTHSTHSSRFRYSPRLHSETGAKRQHQRMSGESKSGL
ncbi:hypothetical protein GB937_006445 [Aspergillus fischeri]|nr:hypothetical protein GB937_006445 [Aspergillus fischeri]